MVCIYCSGNTHVTNSRLQKQANSVWRRRRCQDCDAIFSSIETADLEGSLRVEKENGSLEPFSRDKLFLSLYDSCKHRKAAQEDATALTTTIIGKLLHSSSEPSVPNSLISLISAETLQRFDSAAYVHYVAFHPSAKP